MLNDTSIHIERSRRKTLVLQIEQDNTILVKAPLGVPDRQVRDFVTANNSWIEKHLTKRRSQTALQENEYLFLGKMLQLTPGNYSAISVKRDKLLFPVGLLFRKKKELTTWYMHQAQEIITKQVVSYAKEINTDFKEITFSDTKSQWGRCTYDNRLQFNWRLVMAPLLVINYVVVHELVHTKEKNHTQLFWMKVRRYNPSARQQIKWLKQNGNTLTLH